MERKKRLTPFAINLFPAEALHTTRLRDGYHFTEDALHQMTPHKKARAISALCDSLMREAGHTEYNIIDTCAGIGGNTMAFALNPAVRRVYACECDADTFAMLQHNLQNLRQHTAHDRAATTTVHTLNTRFCPDLLQSLTTAAARWDEAPKGSEQARDAAVGSGLPMGLFIDPPWGLQRPYVDLFHRPLSDLDSSTVCQWLTTAMSLDAIMFVIIKVPKDYPWNDADTPAGTHMRRVTSVAKMDMLCFNHPNKTTTPINTST